MIKLWKSTHTRSGDPLTIEGLSSRDVWNPTVTQISVFQCKTSQWYYNFYSDISGFERIRKTLPAKRSITNQKNRGPSNLTNTIVLPKMLIIFFSIHNPPFSNLRGFHTSWNESQSRGIRSPKLVFLDYHYFKFFSFFVRLILFVCVCDGERKIWACICMYDRKWMCVCIRDRVITTDTRTHTNKHPSTHTHTHTHTHTRTLTHTHTHTRTGIHTLVYTHTHTSERCLFDTRVLIGWLCLWHSLLYPFFRTSTLVCFRDLLVALYPLVLGQFTSLHRTLEFLFDVDITETIFFLHGLWLKQHLCNTMKWKTGIELYYRDVISKILRTLFKVNQRRQLCNTI